MKKLSIWRTLVFCAVLFVFQNSFAQSHQYYYKGEKLSLEVHRQFLNISTSADFDENLINNLGFKPTSFRPETLQRNNEIKKMAVLEFESIPDLLAYKQKIAALKGLRGIETISPYYIGNNNAARGTSNYFYVKLKPDSDYKILAKIAADRNVDIIKNISFMPQWYELSRNENTKGKNSFEVANEFYETGLFEEIDPGIILQYKSGSKSFPCTNPSIIDHCVGDPEFNYQWGLYNHSYPEFDINACDSWAISKGASTLIGIIDGGIDQNHPDLNEVVLYDFDCYDGPPLILPFYDPHGTHVAGIATALQNNNKFVTGVAPEAKVVSVRYPFDAAENFPRIGLNLGAGFNWAVNTKGADVVNCSWGDGGASPNMHDPFLENAIENALLNGRNGLGTVVVFAAGNSGAVRYPANYVEEITAVSGFISDGYSYGSYGNEVDIVAPGVNINSTYPLSTTECLFGTSMSAPHVTGVVAQMLDVNPCLSGQRVRDILETSAQKTNPTTNFYIYDEEAGRPNGTWNDHMGYGLVDALAAVTVSQDTYSPTLDLAIRNSTLDFGVEPDEVSGIPTTVDSQRVLWDSPDIWVRHQNDGIQVHQIPDYAENSNYVNVRVTNKSCVPSSGNNILKIYWANAYRGLSWPAKWNGLPWPGPNGTIVGGSVANITIPSMSPGSEIILTTAWNTPNPDNFTGDNFSLLARIESVADPMTTAEGYSLWTNVKNNNNIAWKNTKLINSPAPFSGQPIAANEALGNEELEIDKFHIYPNPVNSLLTIKNTSDFKVIGVAIHDTKGRLILEENQAVSRMDVSSLKKGIFFITIETEKGKFTRKIVKY
jgi:serine protease